MKNAIYFLLLLLTITACSKDKDPKPSAEVQGNWALTTGGIKINFEGEVDESDFDFEGEGMYLNLKDDNKLESNLGLDYEDEDFFSKVNVYQSTYKIEGDYLTIDVYVKDIDKYIPVKTKISKSEIGNLSLHMSKSEMLALVAEISKYDNISTDLLFLSFVTSIDFTLNFKK
jgi:hypothetical protein